MKFGIKLITYAIGNVASKIVSIALLPIYTRHIETNDYGRADIANSAVTLIVSIAFIEIWTALLRFLFEEREQEYGMQKVFSNVIMITFLLLIPFCVIQIIANLLLGSGYIFISIIYGISYLINQVYQFMARGTGKNQIFVYSGIIASVVQLIFSIVVIYLFEMGAEVILLAPCIGYFVSTLFIEFTCKFSELIRFKFIEKKYIKKLIVFSIPLALNSAAFWLISNFNRYYVAYSMGFDYSSYVSIAGKFTLIVSLAASIYSLAWQESAYEKSNTESRGKYYSEMFNIYIILSTILTALCLPVSRFLFPLMIGEDYQGALVLLGPYFIATFLSGVSNFIAQLFNSEKKTGHLMISTLTGSITNIVLMVALTPFIGIMSAPVSLAFGYLVNTITRYVNITKIVNIKFSIATIFKSMITITIAVIEVLIFDNFVDLLIATIALVIISIAFYWRIMTVLWKRVLSTFIK